LIEHHIDIQTQDGSMNTFVTYPEEGGPFPVVLFYMDAPGKREELHDMARRLGTVGYYVVLPNLYYREVREFQLVRDEPGMKRMFELMRTLSIEMMMRDTEAMLEFVDRQDAADSQELGAVGYCMSGPFVLAAAARFSNRFKCAASIYGAGLVTEREDSPHLTAASVTGEMYFACAATDIYAPPETIAQLDTHLRSAGINYRIESYPDTHHGFAFPQRQGIYHHASAERHWERLFSLFRRNLTRAT
jgi:carboxymethylenebutenolidase